MIYGKKENEIIKDLQWNYMIATLTGEIDEEMKGKIIPLQIQLDNAFEKAMQAESVPITFWKMHGLVRNGGIIKDVRNGVYYSDTSRYVSREDADTLRAMNYSFDYDWTNRARAEQEKNHPDLSRYN